MNVLITGGAGFVGRHITKKLCDIGYDVTVVDNLISESAQHPKSWMKHLKPTRPFKFFEQDTRLFFNNCDEKFDLVIHLAAIVGGRLTIEFSPLQVAEDLSLDAQMFNWATKTKPGKIVFFSSSAAYPIKYQTREFYQSLKEDLINFNDDMIGKPDLTYGWAKLTGEYLAKLAYDRCGLNTVCFRPFSGYGEDQHLNYPFPSILQRVLNSDGQSPITVWGSGDQVRDFIYIDDCVDGMLQIMDKIDDGSAVNLGSGIPTSFKDLIRSMNKVIHGNWDVEFNALMDKPEGVFYRSCDPSMMFEHGFKPTYTLEDGIIRCIELLKDR
jgi:GDP-L-fucose synthase